MERTPQVCVPEGFQPLTEGLATVVFPQDNEVFYNPVQQFNRDLSTVAIRTWAQLVRREQEERVRKHEERGSEDAESKRRRVAGKHPQLSVLEALSATGLRAIRYAKEIPEVDRVVANDMDANAVREIRRNIELNGVQDRVEALNEDALVAMYMAKARKQSFHVIDLDPYGTAAPFIDAAVQTVHDGGLLCITCTDLAVLAGNAYPEKCFSLYGGIGTRTSYCHELALRLVLHTIATSAARYGRTITPLLSLSIDFYVRLFVRVHHSPAEVKHLHANTMLAYACSGCGSWYNQPIGKTFVKGEHKQLEKHTSASGPPVDRACAHCGFTHHIQGPFWGGQLHETSFVGDMLARVATLPRDTYATVERMKGMLTLAQQELQLPFYWDLSQLFSKARTSPPQWSHVASALLNAGYHVSMSHAARGALKTDAPPEMMWNLARSIAKERGVKLDSVSEGSPSRRILHDLDSTPDVDWTRHPDAEPECKKVKLVRYQENPTANWGPKARAGKPKKQDSSA